MSVFCLSSDETIRFWGRFSHHLERLESEGGLVLVSKIRADLATASKQLWGWQEGDDITGVAVTQVLETPRGPCCWIYGAAGTGTGNEIDEIIASIEDWAQSIGCTRVMLQGRKGWRRRLTGFREVGIVLEKEF